MHETFMRRALEIARQSLDEPGALPYGAVVVRDGKVIGEGLNRAVARHDPTSHGETEAIRDACARLGSNDLSGADIYSTAEPCAMCVATMYLVGIRHVYFASPAAESGAFMARVATREPGWRRRMSGAELRREVALDIDRRTMPATPMLADEAHALFDVFARKLGV